MTTRWNKIGPQAASALHEPSAERAPLPVSPAIRATLDLASRVVMVRQQDAWLAAGLLDDLFTTRFLWASDCGRLRFAALGESRRVGYRQLSRALRQAADDLDLPGGMGMQLPLGLFALGETDRRPGAFDLGESETRARCWIPRALLMQDGENLLVICADEDLRQELVLRIGHPQHAADIARQRLILQGRRAGLSETRVDDLECWRQRVHTALSQIEAGTLEKVVVSRRLLFSPADVAFSPSASAWHVSHAENRTGFSISTDAGRTQFIAATPETLLRVRDGRLSTHALAGTRPPGASVDDFLASSKLTREHEYVCDGMVSSLAPFVRAMRPGALHARRAGSVTHLETPLTGMLRPEADPLEILSVLHPTAAIGGWPRPEALRALRDIEPYSRGWFAAPVGWLAGNGDLHATIAIRSLWVARERAVALAGAGIVAGSVADEEWDETEDKFDNMRAAIRGQVIAG